MKKRIIIIFSLIIIAITIVSLYDTFAISSLVMGGNNNYNVTLTNNSIVSVPAKTSKTIYYQVCNTNKGIVRYGVGYISDNIVVKGYYDSEDLVTDTIDYGENKFIKLKLINDTNKDSEVEITTVLGYEFGGDLIPPDNVT